jgi:DNA-directed RNA polymerase specialized sigma subunit
MEERAQPVGNAKIREEFDMDAAMLSHPNTNEECLFERLVELDPPLGRDEALSLLTQWIAQLPPGPKKVLAMHYHEHIRFSQIAACIGVTESLICQIHAQTVALLRNYLWRASKGLPANRFSDRNLLNLIKC